MAANEPGNGNEEEGKQPRSVASPRLRKSNWAQLPHLPDLPLWNVLGFAVDETDYSNVALVCKEWKTFVDRLCPPQLFRMSLLMKQGGTIGAKDVDLFRPVFESLKDPISPLYRSDSETAHPPHVPQGCKAWPDLQPQFNAVMMRFAHSICTQPIPQRKLQLHNLTYTFFEVFAAQMSDEIWKILAKGECQGPSWNNVMCVVDELMSLWRKWEGVVQTVADVTGNIPSVKEDACHSIGTQLFLQLVKDGDVTSSTPFRLLRQVSSLKGEKDWKPEELSLLLSFSRALDSMSRSFPIDDALDFIKRVYSEEVFPQLEVALGRAREEETKIELKNQSESSPPRCHEGADPIKIVTMPERVTFEFAISSHFLASSGFLRKLKLKGGEIIRLDTDHIMLEKAVRFYELDEANPLGDMSGSSQSSNMRDIGSEPFASIINEVSQQELFGLREFADLMDMRGLMELTTLRRFPMPRSRNSRTPFHFPSAYMDRPVNHGGGIGRTKCVRLGFILTEEEKIQLWKKQGKCTHCGEIVTHKKKRGRFIVNFFLEPITVEGMVYKGYCLRCYTPNEARVLLGEPPIDDEPTKKPRSTRPRPRRRRTLRTEPPPHPLLPGADEGGTSTDNVQDVARRTGTVIDDVPPEIMAHAKRPSSFGESVQDDREVAAHHRCDGSADGDEKPLSYRGSIRGDDVVHHQRRNDSGSSDLKPSSI